MGLSDICYAKFQKNEESLQFFNRIILTTNMFSNVNFTFYLMLTGGVFLNFPSSGGGVTKTLAG